MPASPITVTGAFDGPQLTVDALIRNPTLVPRRILSMANQLFVGDKLLRNIGKAPSGVVEFFQSNPLFANTTSSVVREYAEIPVSTGAVGPLLLAQVVKRGLSLRISREMRDRNDIDLVNLQIMQIANTMVQDWDAAWINAILAADTLTVAATATWESSTANPRLDIADAVKAIVSTKYGFIPDTLVISVGSHADLIGSATIWQPWSGDMAHASPAVRGALPAKLYGLDVWQTYSLPAATAIVMQRKVAGFIADERPLQATPLYEIPERETWRSDTVRASAVGIDQPNAICTITGVE